MKKLEFNINIDAYPEKVWKTLWDQDTYRIWTSPFSEGSYYKTDNFTEGNKIHFLTPDGDGMYSIIDRIEPNSHLTFRHIGTIQNFEELPISQGSGAWTNALETYTLRTTGNGSTQLQVAVDIVDEYIDTMNNTFPIALKKLKQLVEQ